MKVTPIARPLPGERVLAVWPRMAISVAAGWHRRLNLTTGRSLSDSALTAEQDGRVGRLVTLAQMLSPGVVTGLEIDLHAAAQPIPVVQRLHIAAGMGLTAWGEDVVVPHALSVAVNDLVPVPLRVPSTFGILVLEPVTVRRAGRFDPKDPCDVDESNDAFADEQNVDGCRLVYLPWQDTWGPLPAGSPATFRNRIAYHIFSLEQALPFGEIQPWELRGVPIGVMAFGTSGADFVDRHSVAREGGKAKGRTPLVPGSSTAFLAQARLRQFVEQLAGQGDLPVVQRIAAYARLPPAGILPRNAVDLVERSNSFFPPTFSVRAIPLPVEQLDQVIESSASLAPIDTGHGERIILLVPVPQSVYEPGLLIVEVVAPIFQQRIGQFSGERDAARRLRLSVRRDYRALVRATEGMAAVPKYAEFDPGTPPEPDALPDEPPLLATNPAAFTPNPAASGGRFGVEDGPAATQVVIALRDLRTKLVQDNLFTTAEMTDFDANTGLAAFVDKMKRKLEQADDTVDFSFLKSHPNIYRIRQHLLGSTAATRLATSPVLASIAKGDSAEAVTDEVNRYFFAVTGRTPPGTLKPPGATPGTAEGIRSAPPPGGSAPPPAPSGMVGGPQAEFLNATAPMRAPPLGFELPGTAGAVSRVDLGRLVEADRLSGRLQSGAGGFELLEATLSPTRVALPTPTKTTVKNAQPVAGAGAYDFRTTSIVKRIDDPAAQEAKAYAVAARVEALEAIEVLATLNMKVDDIQVFGLPVFATDGAPQHHLPFILSNGREVRSETAPFRGLDNEVVTPPAGTTVAAQNPRANLPLRRTLTFGALRGGAGGIKTILRDPPVINGDESSFFSEAVIIIEHMIAVLRAVEGRIAQYRAEVAACEQVLAEINGAKERASARLADLDGSIVEARHKVATARALLADEIKRIEAINTRRKSVLRDHVKFLAYVRPRFMDARVDTPVLYLNPGLSEAPVPACLATHDEVPADLEQMVQLLREAPVAWFTAGPKLLEKLDRVELLHGTLQIAKLRATVLRDADQVPATFVKGQSPGRFGAAIARVTQAHQRVVAQYRFQIASLDLSRFAGRGWRESREAAVHILSLGDLIESNHGRSAVADAAARELSQITRIAGCLHAQASEVLPVIRLQWADRLSQYEESVDLRDLTVLPRWGELDFILRKEIQTLADWLYGRIDRKHADGTAWMNDLVRVCLLLASHAPINEIVAGQIITPTPATPGQTVPVTIDPTRVRLGMKVFFYRQTQVVAHGVVEDLVGGQARARIAETVGENVMLDSATRAQFVSHGARDLPTFMRKLV